MTIRQPTEYGRKQRGGNSEYRDPDTDLLHIPAKFGFERFEQEPEHIER
jgi:hypothetical protein